MAKKFNTYVAVHKDPAESVWFAPGDEVPDWALDLVGDHVYGGTHEADSDVDVRLTDPENEPDDPDTKWSSPNALPASVDADASMEDVDYDYSDLKKDELVALADERGIDSSGTKADIIARVEEDDEEE